MTTAPDENHVHDCSGPTRTCACGYVFYVPPVFVSIEIGSGRTTLINEAFNCESLETAVKALRDAAIRLERR